jgi:hypothetical protein
MIINDKKMTLNVSFVVKLPLWIKASMTALVA